MSRTYKDSIRREFLARSERQRMNRKLRRFVDKLDALPDSRTIERFASLCEERGIPVRQSA